MIVHYLAMQYTNPWVALFVHSFKGQGAVEWDSDGGSVHASQMEGLLTGINTTNAKLPWFALQVHTTRESSVAHLLRGKGYELFLPLYQRRRRWSDRIKIVDAPLFPGYVFCQLDIQNRLPVLMTPGVTRIVGSSRTLVPIDELEINAIHALVASGLPREPWPFLQVGDRVRIERGPLSGLEGILLSMRGTHRLVLSISLLRRSVALEIDATSVKWMRSASMRRNSLGGDRLGFENRQDIEANSFCLAAPGD